MTEIAVGMVGLFVGYMIGLYNCRRLIRCRVAAKIEAAVAKAEGG